MDGAQLWKLFWATGHPAVWIAIRRLADGEDKRAIPACKQRVWREI